MNRLIFILLFLSNISFAQTNEKFLTDFLLGDELETINVIDHFKQFDFSKLWTKTENHFIYGIIGTEHQRIRIKLTSVLKNSANQNEYFISGKSYVKGTICDFNGTINLIEIKKVKELHFGIDNNYENKGIKSQGILIANYSFNENKEQKHSGIFKGQLYSKWFMDSKNVIKYDDIQFGSDGYTNNAFIGIWESFNTGKEKNCNWADYRVPNANQDFDIGAGEFSVSEKYWNKGWFDVALKNKIPNNAIKRDKKSTKTKEWWE